MKSLIVCFLCLAAVGCASKEKSNPFDPLTLEKVLVVGESDQQTVVNEFGQPNQVARGSNVGETWTYANHSTNFNSSSQSVGLGLLGYFSSGLFSGLRFGSYGGSTSSKSMSLVINFDEENLLASYQIVESSF